jgi:potassium-transporting ATPase KdpC subunit
MKQHIFPAIRLTLVSSVLLMGLYPLLIREAALLTPGKGEGVTVSLHGRSVGYALEGQSFTAPGYFHGRPSAVSYNAAGSAGSNKGPTNPDYLQGVKDNIDSLLKDNPGISRTEINAELVTASGSGLDPDISSASAYLQVGRVAKARHMEAAAVTEVITHEVKKPLLGLFGTETVNVLALNLELDKFQK